MTKPLSANHLSDISPTDKPWDGHRRDAELITKGFDEGGCERYAERMQQCSTRLAFAQEARDNGNIGLQLYAAKFCRVRLCPTCQWRKQLMWRARFFKALPAYLTDHPSYTPVLLTLTLRNCDLTELRETIQHLHQSFKRLTERKCWPARGWVRSLEVTRNPDTAQAHPHLHVLMFVRKAYFRGKGYVKQAEWVQIWRECLQVDYDPNIDIRRIKGSTETDGVWDKFTDKKSTVKNAETQALSDTGHIADSAKIDTNIMKGICETLKYSVKPSDITDNPDWLTGLAGQLHNMRTVGVGGDLRDYLRDEEPEDLIHGDEDEIPDLSEYAHIVFDWASELKAYVLGRQY